MKTRHLALKLTLKFSGLRLNRSNSVSDTWLFF
jgi:hypothetical protein